MLPLGKMIGEMQENEQEHGNKHFSCEVLLLRLM